MTDKIQRLTDNFVECTRSCARIGIPRRTIEEGVACLVDSGTLSIDDAKELMGRVIRAYKEENGCWPPPA